jgi:hypothetical protein
VGFFARVARSRLMQTHYFYLYYKERRLLKTFLTQIGPALPLTRGPTRHMFFEVDKVEEL